MNLKSLRRNRLLLLLALIVLLAMLAIIAAATYGQADEREDEQRIEIIEEYLSVLVNPEAEATPALTGIGKDTEEFPGAIMTLEEAERAGLLGDNAVVDEPARLHNASIATRQHKLVTDIFGEDAWDHVSYRLVPDEPQGDKEIYIVKATGEEVTYDDYLRLNKAYWEDLLEQMGLDYYDVFYNYDFESEEDSHIIKRTDVYVDNVRNEPVTISMSADYEFYQVYLAFKGEEESADGLYYGFRFSIRNPTGAWEVFEGFTWENYQDLTPVIENIYPEGFFAED